MMESEGKMTTTDARGWINALIKAMHEETSGSWPDPEYKDEVYSALEMAVQALSQEPTEICCATCKHERLDDINYKCEFQNECLVEGKRGKYEFAYAKYEPIVEQEPCTDAVSRDEAINTAIDAVDDWDGGTNLRRTEIITNAMKQIPSVNPQYIGNEFFNFDAPMVKKSMEQDAVSRQAVLDLVNSDWKYEGLETDVASLPSVTQKSKAGHWISYYDEDAKVYWYECDRCHAERAFNTDYCPDCGCRMVATQERSE